MTTTRRGYVDITSEIRRKEDNISVSVGNAQVPVFDRCIPSTSNNTTTPLSASATFTGASGLCEHKEV